MPPDMLQWHNHRGLREMYFGRSCNSLEYFSAALMIHLYSWTCDWSSDKLLAPDIFSTVLFNTCVGRSPPSLCTWMKFFGHQELAKGVGGEEGTVGCEGTGVNCHHQSTSLLCNIRLPSGKEAAVVFLSSSAESRAPGPAVR